MEPLDCATDGPGLVSYNNSIKRSVAFQRFCGSYSLSPLDGSSGSTVTKKYSCRTWLIRRQKKKEGRTLFCCRNTLWISGECEWFYSGEDFWKPAAVTSTTAKAECWTYMSTIASASWLWLVRFLDTTCWFLGTSIASGTARCRFQVRSHHPLGTKTPQ